MGLLDKLFGGGLLGGLATLGSQWMANRQAKKQQKSEQNFNAKQAELNRDFQTSEREAAQQWNLEQWERENEYNSPAAQMQRMAEAGINPAAAAQAIAGGSSGAVQQSSVAGSSNPQSGAVASTSGSYAPTMATLLGNSVNSAVNTSLTIGQTISQHIHNKNLQKQYDAAIDNLVSTTAKNYQDVEVGKQQGAFIAAQADRLKKLTPAELEQCKQQTNLIMAQILNTDVDTSLKGSEIEQTNAEIAGIKASTAATYQSIKESKVRIANLDANTSLAIAEASKVYAETNNIEADTVIKNFEAAVKQLEAEAAANGVVFNASEAAAGAVYEMVNGTGSSKDFYQPVSDYEKGIIKEEHKQKRRDAWNQAGANVVEGAVGKVLGKIFK